MNQRHTPPPRFEARVNRKKLYLMLAVAVVGYAVLWFFVGRVERILFGVCVLIGVAYGVKEALLDNSRIVIDERGVLDSRLGLGTIHWRDITRVYIAEFQSVAHICMDVANPDKYLMKRSMATRGLLKFHRWKNDISPFNINAGVLDAGTDEIYEAVIAGCEFYGAPLGK